MVLAFATVGLYVIYLVYRYNLLYIYNTEIDTRGLVYPRALLQLLVGLYLAEVCMIGLFALRSAFAPMLIMIIFLVLSVLIHLSIDDAISPLLYNLPRTLPIESEELAGGCMPFEIGQNDVITGQPPSQSSPASSSTLRPHDSFDVVEDDDGKEDIEENITPRTRGGGIQVEGAEGFMSSILDNTKEKATKRLRTHAEALGLTGVLAYFQYWIKPDRNIQPNFVLRWLHPGIFEDFSTLQKMLPPDMPDPTESYPRNYAHDAYWPPVMTTPLESLWIPRDEGGVSRQEVKHSGEVIEITDEGAWLDENGRVKLDFEKAPYWKPRILY